ncbi:MAG: AarF/ABC1/UbiB kinase family protein [Oscillatoriaceae bacterium SKW80]|nr:AarF/ABC1/UbiB kinase family protein [Oscillatoriaceae bacterium SKYG93]MCX8121789.1 AarF/ABC1/UbiB kinase family protein [Oscillatoriaceae bacterium SKW80]MDW8452556.1 AarF/ABC1/UbiB kinase family protein [Oscillatoriaceae cyanobacterium SKYGB_i_bin93]HIK28659.1 AarF/ABC1/UbiB kinase family protein [Oscillatoriaceae cyanobacterium M7585_C2015_266]
MLKLKAGPKPLRWQRPNYSPLARQLDVFQAAARFIFYLWWDRTFGNNSPAQNKRRAQWLVNTLLHLGPTFIKIGQALSTRIDLLPLEYVQALSELQDKVPPFSAEVAIATIETELGKPLFTLFRDFDHQPIAAASLGQVHKARLHSGEEVVVKVQRPGLKQLFDVDVKAVHKILRFCQRYFPWTKKYDLEAIYQEFFKILYQEIDYLQEAQNAERFRQNFKDYPGIIVPKVYWQYTTHKVLTVEYLPGIKVDDRQTLIACGINVKKLNQLGICCYLKQLLLDGFFQADPHPGNLAVSQDGSLIFYDFGMMGEVKALAKEQMVKNFFAILKKDTDEVVNTLIQMGLIEPVSDMTPVKRLIDFLLEKFTEKPIDFQAFVEIKSELYMMFEQQPFRLPAQMTFVLKALTTLDGIARTLDPEYNLIACAQPFVKSLTVYKGQGTLGELARQARDFIKFKLQQPSTAEILIRRLEKRIEEGELKVRVRSLESERALRRIHMAVKSLTYACLSGFVLLTGTILLVGGYKGGAIAAFVCAAVCFIALARSLFALSIREKLDKLAEK